MFSVLVKTDRLLVNGIYEMRVVVDHAGDWSVYTEDENDLTVIGKVDAATVDALEADPLVLVISGAEVFDDDTA